MAREPQTTDAEKYQILVDVKEFLSLAFTLDKIRLQWRKCYKNTGAACWFLDWPWWPWMVN